jgi:hypothetical protein
MRVRRFCLRISLGGLGLLAVLMAIVASLHGNALVLLYAAYLWVELWAAIGLVALLITLAFKAVNRLARLT